MNKNNAHVLLIILIFISIILNSYDFLKSPYYFVKDLIYYPVRALSEKDITISNSLKDSIITGLQEDVNNLLELNKMTLSLNNFDYVNATVISRNREYWFNNLTINKGKKDGINIDMAVIDSNGLIGRISSVGDNTSTVKLITTNDTISKVSAVILSKQEKVYGIINGYDSENNLLHLIITDNIEIEKGALVETTGMGGIFPSNILIGTVYDTFKKNDGVTNIVRVKPSSNIEGERYVAVIERREISNN